MAIIAPIDRANPKKINVFFFIFITIHNIPYSKKYFNLILLFYLLNGKIIDRK
jgi:hypothetical protein